MIPRLTRPPKAWPRRIKRALLNITAIASSILTRTSAMAADSALARVKLRAKVTQLEAEVGLLKEEIRIKDERLRQIPPAQRPHYPPIARLAILRLREARHWSAAQAARVFLLTGPTIASRNRRIDDDHLVKAPVAINRLPVFVDAVVHQLKATAPLLGKRYIAQALTRVGLQVSATSVGRILKRTPSKPPSAPAPKKQATAEPAKPRKIVAKHPHHVWHVDLTIFPLGGGFRLPWLPFALPPIWPIAFWIALVLDRYSSGIVAFKVYRGPPSAQQITRLLSEAERRAGRAPKSIITDHGVQFQGLYRAWCKARSVRPRYGAIQKSNSLAVIERCIRSIKTECLRRIFLPFDLAFVERELAVYFRWYHLNRPHQGLGGLVPANLTTLSPCYVAGKELRHVSKHQHQSSQGTRTIRVPPRISCRA